MVAIFSLGLFGISTTCMGYAFKKSWLLWLSIPFWFLLSLYMAYEESWFPAAAQHSLLLIGIGTTIGLGYAAIRMQGHQIKNMNADDTLDDQDSSLVAYQAEVDSYKKYSQAYSYNPKRKKKSPPES